MGATQSAPQPKTPQDAANTFIDDALKSAHVVVFSRTDCGYCEAAKRVIKTETLRVKRSGCEAASPPRVLELDEELDPVRARAVVSALAERTGASTVPRVFIGGSFVGGAEDTARYARSGALNAALRAGAGCPPRDR